MPDIIDLWWNWTQQNQIDSLRRDSARARALAEHTKLRSADLSKTLSDLVLTWKAFERLGLQKGLFTREELEASMREIFAEHQAAQAQAKQRSATTPLRRKKLGAHARRR